MLKNFLARRRSSKSLSTVLNITSVGLRAYLESDAVTSALRVLDGQAYSFEATAGLYQQVKLVVVETEGEWTSTLMRLNEDSRTISTSPAFSFIYALDVPQGLSLDLYEVEGFPEPGDIPGPMSLRAVGSRPIQTGDTIDLKPGPRAWILRGPTAGSKFLRLTGGMSETIIAAFDCDDLSFSSIAYADVEATSASFFSAFSDQLLTNMRDCYGDGDWPVDMTPLVAFFDDAAGSADLDPFTRWRAIQLLGKFDPSAAISHLSRLRDGAAVRLAEAAARVLSRVEPAPPA